MMKNSGKTNQPINTPSAKPNGIVISDTPIMKILEEFSKFAECFVYNGSNLVHACSYGKTMYAKTKLHELVTAGCPAFAIYDLKNFLRLSNSISDCPTISLHKNGLEIHITGDRGQNITYTTSDVSVLNSESYPLQELRTNINQWKYSIKFSEYDHNVGVEILKISSMLNADKIILNIYEYEEEAQFIISNNNCVWESELFRIYSPFENPNIPGLTVTSKANKSISIDPKKLFFLGKGHVNYIDIFENPELLVCTTNRLDVTYIIPIEYLPTPLDPTK